MVRGSNSATSMAESTRSSLFGLFNKLQEVLSSGASSSCPPVVPQLTQLNDMVYEVYSPLPEKKPDLEIIFFHGLQLRYCKEAHYTTWMSHDNSQLWLQTWLVEEFKNARVLTVAYDSSTQRTDQGGNLDMYCTAENLVSSLTSDGVRVGHAKCPVVLVGHCMGGLVLKEVCRSAAWMLGRKSLDLPDVKRVHELLSNLRGMFFFGTPHAGSLLFDELHDNVKGALVQEIEILNSSSARRNDEFRELKARYNWLTYGMGEQQETFVECLGKSIHVVKEASARPCMDSYYTANSNHFNICKPEGKHDSAFQFLANFLHKIQEDGIHQAQVRDDIESSQDYVVDSQDRARQVFNMLAQPNAKMIFITGLSGIGKTTLARRVLHDLGHNFALTCFVSLDNIEGSSSLTKEVLEKVQDGLEGDFSEPRHSQRNVLNLLKGKDVLMVLDNVESQDQIDALHKKTWLEGSKSKLIVTTRNSRLGSTSNSYEVPYLSSGEAHQLFLHYAFEGAAGPHGVKDDVNLVIKRCGNFPLFLKFLGRYVSTWEDVHDRRLWVELLERMERAEEVEGGHDYRLWAKLRPLYDALGPSEKELFLDIATIFHGFSFTMVECMWNACRQSSHLAWRNLKHRFLSNVDKKGKIRMLGQLRDMGRSIACPHNLALDKWSRVSEATSARRLIANYQGNVEALGLKLQKADIERLLLAEGTFVPYTRLQYLILEGAEMRGDRVQLPGSLVYLKWTNGVFHTCPVDFTRLEKLVVLDLSHCRTMKTFSTSLANARKLEWLELEGCRSLTDSALGEFNFYHLKYFGVSQTNLTKLPRSLGKSKDLRSLQAEETLLTRVPRWVERLTMLVSLNFVGTRVTRLPEAIGNLKFLKTLNLQGTLIRSLPESVGEIVGLERLYLAGTLLDSFPVPILKLRSLKYLSLFGTQISTVPDAIGELAELEKLHINKTRLTIVPKAIGKLLGLKELFTVISRDESLQHLASLQSLQILRLDIGEESPLLLREENSQTEISSLLSPLSSLRQLSTLFLGGKNCPQSMLPPLLCALQQLPSLHQLQFIEFNLVETMPCELGTLTGLKQLVIYDCARLRELPESLGNLCMLSELNLYYLPMLSRLPESLGALPALRALVIFKCASLQSMPRSMGHVSPLEQESFSSESSERPPSDDSPPRRSPSQLQSMRLATDSWTLLECFLECCRGHASSQWGQCFVACAEMERIIVASEEKEGGGYVVNTKVAAELFREMNFSLQGREIGFHEGSGRYTSHPPWHHCCDFQNVHVCCSVWDGRTWSVWNDCDVHTYPIKVMDTEEGSDGSIEETDSETESLEDADSESNEDDEQDEDLGLLGNLPGSSSEATGLRWTLHRPAEVFPSPIKSESNEASQCTAVNRVLHRTACDGCDMDPIVGTRFKSTKKDDYDLCSNCFEKADDQADFTQINRSLRKGRQAG